MSFNPSSKTLAYWRKSKPIPATETDIALLEARLGGKAPASYVQFMKTYGNVEFDTDIDSRFEYTYVADRTEQQSQWISFIKSPQNALLYYEGLQKDPKTGLPEYLLPFGMDYGQGELLIEFGQPTERIFYWDFDRHDWECGAARLAFVADDFFRFVNSLA